jgi:hypothetical protein
MGRDAVTDHPNTAASDLLWREVLLLKMSRQIAEFVSAKASCFRVNLHEGALLDGRICAG